jgi:hypothetical protein
MRLTARNICTEITKAYAQVIDEIVHVPEHMHRRCANCGYNWAEAPADAAS